MSDPEKAASGLTLYPSLYHLRAWQRTKGARTWLFHSSSLLCIIVLPSATGGTVRMIGWGQWETRKRKGSFSFPVMAFFIPFLFTVSLPAVTSECQWQETVSGKKWPSTHFIRFHMISCLFPSFVAIRCLMVTHLLPRLLASNWVLVNSMERRDEARASFMSSLYLISGRVLAGKKCKSQDIDPSPFPVLSVIHFIHWQDTQGKGMREVTSYGGYRRDIMPPITSLSLVHSFHLPPVAVIPWTRRLKGEGTGRTSPSASLPLTAGTLEMTANSPSSASLVSLPLFYFPRPERRERKEWNGRSWPRESDGWERFPGIHSLTPHPSMKFLRFDGWLGMNEGIVSEASGQSLPCLFSFLCSLSVWSWVKDLTKETTKRREREGTGKERVCGLSISVTSPHMSLLSPLHLTHEFTN